MTTAFEATAREFIAMNPEVRAVEVFVTDLNGAPRGKLAPIASLEKLGSGGGKMPLSSLGLDVFGCDVGRSRIALEIGDPDGVLLPIPDTLARMSWAERPTAQVQAMLVDSATANVAEIDPRGALSGVADKARAMGLTPVMALELEFYLIAAERDGQRRPQPPVSPVGGARLARNQIYDMNVLRAFEPVIADIADACQTLGAPADTAICEFGPGQFEMNLTHSPDPMAAADHAIMMKRAIRGVARAHGYDATFMAKPYGDSAGSGMHIHLSFLDADGANIFAEGDGDGLPNPAMRAALGGLVETMADGMAIFAPHYNSYRRFIPGSYAPMCAAWGVDNRGSALRAPETRGAGARIEHRVSGADANPYLVAAYVLAGALHGIENKCDPGEPVRGEPNQESAEALPLDWLVALNRFEKSPFAGAALGEQLRRVYAAMKRQERETLLGFVPDAEYDAYLRTV